ncbi:phage terminase small subunit [Photobacterium phosphoreum]|uniref:phage terminase small subunit n=1 Tax=Photobacterium phosphoreum TaxID=659 RepID=UPI001E30EDBB|nr:phage terminase small subunit [Photobacterium phosphoreum]MCD9511929.1 terminase [Photobacterium phosphoreum]
MRRSPCSRDKEIKHARSTVERAYKTGVLSPESNSLHLQLIALDTDLKRLKKLDRIQDKVAMKRDELLPKYQPYVERYLAEGDVFKNGLFAHVVVWLFDVEAFDQAIKWGLVCIAQDQPTPDGIKRNFPTLIADIMLEWCERQAENGQPVEPYCSTIFSKVRHEWRLNEKITAKWFKFVGLLFIRDSNGKPLPSAQDDVEKLKAAQVLFFEAHKLNKNIGVKTLIEKIDMRIRKLADS